MLDHFHVHEWLRLPSTHELFDTRNDLVHTTSVVLHAAFTNGKPLPTDKFSKVLGTTIFRECFEDCFMPSLKELHPDSRFIALGVAAFEALHWCAGKGVIDRSQIIGSVVYPSPGAGTQVDVFLGKKLISTLTPGDPVRNRIPYFRRYYDTMVNSMSPLLGRPVAKSDDIYGAT